MIGQTLKNYTIEEILGKGGMGVVYRARDVRLGRSVALKVIRPELCSDEERRKRFVQEARAASAVSHPAIAHLYEIDDTGDPTFIVMEFVEGSTLRELIARRELDPPSAIEVFIQIADALARAHEAGIIHRDIKSDNIMVTKDGHPKILDFGLAKLLAPVFGSADSKVETATLTGTGMILGTVTYMSPEQARGLPSDKRSDIFSFGIVLYEAVAGKVPFEGSSALDTMHALAFEQAQPVATLRPGLPYSLQLVIDRCLQKKPEDRYQDMREVVTALRSVKREIDSGVSGRVPIMDQLRWWLRGFSTRGILWGGVAVAGLGTLAVLFAASDRGPNVPAVLLFVGLGFYFFRRFRNRAQREVRRFVKRASALREVRLVSFHQGQFMVLADDPSARTYVKLNALLTTANERLFRGDPMTMVVRDKVEDEEIKRILSSPGVQFVRDDRQRSSLSARSRRRKG